MSKHTPGPWMIDDPDGEFGLQIIVSDKTGIATACYGRGRKTDLANAALIAAAPDLLQAAHNLLAYLSESGDPFQDKLEAALVAAIVKAEGNT